MGYVFTIGGCVVSWKASLQTTVALSTTKVGYIAISNTINCTCYFQGYSLVQILETSTEGGKAPTNSRCLSSFGGGGDGSFCNAWMALECKN